MIRSQGILWPVIARKIADRLFEVIDGERRVYRAQRLAERGGFPFERQSIPCLLVTPANAQQMALWRLTANAHTNLPAEEVEGLMQAAGLQGQSTRNKKHINGTAVEASGFLNDLINAVAQRRTVIRGGRRAVQILEVARNYSAGMTPFQDALDRIRRACQDSE